MKLRFYFCIATLLFFLIEEKSAFSQERQPIFNSVSLPDGMPGGFFNGIWQDPQGFLWLTSIYGLFKYDGYQFTQYQHDPLNTNSISVDWTECVYADHQGIIWVGTTSGGLNRFDPVTGVFKRFANKQGNAESLSNDKVTCILEDSKENFWIGTAGGLNKFDRKTGKFTRYLHNANDSTSLSFDDVRAIYEDRQGTIWVGCGEPDDDGGGLNRFNPGTGKFIRYLHNPKDSNSLIDNHVRAIFEDSHGVFWIGTAGDGLHTMDRAKGIFERHLYDPKHPDKLSRPHTKNIFGEMNDIINFITEDITGAIWIGTLSSGINRYDPNTKKISH